MASPRSLRLRFPPILLAILGAVTIFLTLGGCPLSAQDPAVADLALELVTGPTGITPPGSEGIVEFRITNLGPDDAGEPPITANNVTIRTRLPFSDEIGSPII